MKQAQPKSRQTRSIKVRVTPEQDAAYKQAAQSLGMYTATWIRTVLSEACRKKPT